MLTITLPQLPPREFNPNSRGSWHQRNRANHRAKNDVIALVREQGWQGPALCGATVAITWGGFAEARAEAREAAAWLVAFAEQWKQPGSMPANARLDKGLSISGLKWNW